MIFDVTPSDNVSFPMKTCFLLPQDPLMILALGMYPASAKVAVRIN